MEEDKKIEVYTGDSLSNTIPTSVVLTGEDALRSQVQADQETQAAVERNKEEDKGLTGTLSDFGSYEFSADNLPLFNGFQIKILMSGTNQALYPRIKDLRVIASKS